MLVTGGCGGHMLVPSDKYLKVTASECSNGAIKFGVIHMFRPK